MDLFMYAVMKSRKSGRTPQGAKQISENGVYDVADFASVEVSVPQGVFPDGKITIAQNGTDINVREYDKADVAVPVPAMPEEYVIGGSYADRSLVGYHFKSGITQLSADIFFDCTKLEFFENFPNISSIPDYMVQKCTKFNIGALPNTVTSIGSKAFQKNSSLTLNVLPSGLMTIAANAFEECTKITISEVPHGVTVLTNSVFFHCISITNLRFLGSITQVQDYALADMTGCVLFDFRNNISVPTLANTRAFRNINVNCKIVVPDSLVNTWKAATNWVSYEDHIIGVSEYNNQQTG